MNRTENDRRRWARLPWEVESVEIRTATGETEAQVLNISFGGMAVRVEGDFPVVQGELLEVCWNNAWMAGAASHVEAEERATRVGIQWQTEASSTSAATATDTLAEEADTLATAPETAGDAAR